MNKEFKQSLIKSWRSIYNLLPVLIGVILLISLVNALMPKAYYSKLFSKNIFLDSIIGSGLGSIMAGNPITSYILGGEFLKQGISLVAVTAFMVAWVTVGIVQLPAESLMLGKKFAIMRNILSFLFSIMVAIVTVFVLGLI